VVLRDERIEDIGSKGKSRFEVVRRKRISPNFQEIE